MESMDVVIERADEEEKKDKLTRTGKTRGNIIYFDQLFLVYSWGNGCSGNLGNGKGDYEPLPYNIKQLNNKSIVKIQCGEWYCGALTDNGVLYGWGKSSRARFGITSANDVVYEPTQIPLKFKVLTFAGGYWHSLGVSTDKHVYSVGDNKKGALGLGDTESVSTFTKIPDLDNIKKVAAGSGFSLFLDSEGSLLSGGGKEANGHSKKLGDVLNPQKITSIESEISFIDCGVDHAAAITTSGQLYTWGSNTFLQLGNTKAKFLKTPTLVSSLSDVKVISVSGSTGLKHCQTAGVDSEGNAYFWGCGYKGKLGNVEEWNHDRDCDEEIPKKLVFEPRVAHAESGGIHSGIYDEEGKLYTFGGGSHGRLGHQKYIDGKYRHLYKESQPKRVEFFDKVGRVIDYSSTYSSNVALVELFE